MNRVTITLTIDLPDGVVPEVGYGTAPVVAQTLAVMDEPPLPEPPDMISEAQRIFEAKSSEARSVHSGPASTPNCPDGHGAMKFVPGGVSKRTGKAFSAFYSCDNRDCKRTQDAA